MQSIPPKTTNWFIMKLGRILIVLCMLCLVGSAWGQNSSVDLTGRVVEEGTNMPIEQATIRLFGLLS